MPQDSPHDSFHNKKTEGADNLKRKLGKYELLRPLGRGGMGEVWLAQDTVADVPVALKMLPPELRYNEEAQQQIRDSYRKVYNLNHQYICGVKDLVLDPAVGFFLVMEYFDGVTFSKYRHFFVSKKGTFPLEETVRLLAPVAAALDFAHSQKLSHRDIKPSNLLVSRDGTRQVRVIDFQLASEIRTTVSRYTSVRLDTSGTYPYMAPEQFQGQRASALSDQFALAMVAYELLAGELPFEAHSFDQWKSLITDTSIPIPKIPNLPAHVQRAFDAALSRDPFRRPSNCVKMVEMLQSASTFPAHLPSEIELEMVEDVQPTPRWRGDSPPIERPSKSSDRSKPRPTVLPLGRFSDSQEPDARQSHVSPTDAVSPSLEFASFGERVSAYIIDLVISSVLGFILGFIMGVMLFSSGAPQDGIVVLGNMLGIAVGWLYQAFFESSIYMATPGKTMMGLQVTTEDGERLSFARATGRHFSRMLVGIACFAMLWSQKSQCVHDMMAKTIVVRTKKK